MRAFRGMQGAMLLVLSLSLITGCGSHRSASSADSASARAPDNPSVSDTTPATEGSGPESPQQSQNGGPSISLASLPVGGGAVGDSSGAQQCVGVNWVGSKPIPTGINIQLTGFATSPSGIFTIGGNACPSDQPKCNSWHWAQNNQDIACVVPGIQVADGQGDVVLSVSATVQCPDQATCDNFQKSVANGPGSSVAFSASHDNVSAGSSSATSAGSSDSGSASAGSSSSTG